MTRGTVWPPTAKGVAAAVAALRRGAVIAFPTDTVFGLAALASDPEAVRLIAVIKGRPPEQPLILMAASAEEMAPFAELGAIGIGLAGRFWPGPLTL
ncbi:MAG: Sua5/YciO/YrdC/YwlC family protein, partial [Candidatus Dormiibacterota bacterium]